MDERAEAHLDKRLCQLTIDDARGIIRWMDDLFGRGSPSGTDPSEGRIAI